MADAEARHEAPLELYETRVRPEWVDYNGHMSEAFYVLVFGYATDALLDHIGLNAEARRESGMSVYTLESHIRYLREVAGGEPLYVTTQLLDLDHKRAHVWHAMHHREDERLLATSELMLMNVDLATPSSAPFLTEVYERLGELREAHALLPTPKHAGSSIGLS